MNIIWELKNSLFDSFHVADWQGLHQNNGNGKMYYLILNHAFFSSIFQFGGWNMQSKILIGMLLI